MANAAGILWEFQPTAGASANGGGFDPSVVAPGTNHALAGTTFSRADIAIEADTTTITSAGDPFASDDDGNVIQITAGGTATPGYYTILSEAAGVAQLDRSAGTAGGSVTGGIGPLDILTDAFLDGAAGTLGPQAGDTIYLKDDGTMTLGGNIFLTKDGTATEPIIIEGYNATRGDEPTGTNRPLIAAGANQFSFDNWWVFRHLRLTTTQANGFDGDAQLRFENCSSVNSSGTGGRSAFNVLVNAHFADCDGASTNGDAFSADGSTHVVKRCHAHDSDVGINLAATGGWHIADSIIEACATAGISITSGSGQLIDGNTIDTCVIGLSVTSGGHALRVKNNIFSHNTTKGAQADAAHDSNQFDWNNWHDNAGGDVSNFTKGSNATATDPDYEGADDFRSKTGAGVRDAGEGIRLGVGAAGTPDQGAFQSAGGAGGGQARFRESNL